MTRGSEFGKAIFTADLQASHQMLCAKFFSKHIDAQLFKAILIRQDTPLEYVKFVADEISAGRISSLTHESMRGMIMNCSTSSLKTFLNKSVVATEVRAENEAYRIFNEEEKQLRQLELGRRLMGLIEEEELHTALPTAGGAGGGEDEVDGEEEESGLHASFNAAATAAGGGGGGGGGEGTFLWIPSALDHVSSAAACGEGGDFTWFWTVFYRVNGAHLLLQTERGKDLFFRHKIDLFCNKAHLKMVQYIDSFAVPSDTNMDIPHLLSLYVPLGSSHFDCDKSLVKVHRTAHLIRQTPLQIIRRAYPDLLWTPEQVADAIRAKTVDVSKLTLWLHEEWNPTGEGLPVETHTLYYGIVYVLNQIAEVLAELSAELSAASAAESSRVATGGANSAPPSASADGGALIVALWHYYVSFVDFFQAMHNKPLHDLYLLTPIDSQLSRDGVTIISSEKCTPWMLYGTCDTRAFTAEDLPDFYHVLASIPLRGEQKAPSYFLGKIYQKSLPFACQRRHLIKLVARSVNQSPQFANIVCKLAWVMLANLYPGAMYQAQNYNMKMRDLLRIRELTDRIDTLMHVLNLSETENGGPLIILTVFRMHILYMASFNEQYVEQARKCIEWDNYVKDVLKLRNIICAHSLFAPDPFALARKELGKTVKSPHSKVHRLRKKTVTVCLMECFNETFEKTVLKDKQNFSLDLIKLEGALATPARSAGVARGERGERGDRGTPLAGALRAPTNGG